MGQNGTTGLFGFGRLFPPRLRRLPGDLTPLFGGEGFGPRWATGYTALAGNRRELFGREILGPSPATLGASELA